MKQTIYTNAADYLGIDDWVRQNSVRNILLVCGASLRRMIPLRQKLVNLDKENVRMVPFQDFHANPSYDSVVRGVEVFRREGCDSIMAVGGGSAMDVAKCVRLYCNMPGDGAEGAYLKLPVQAGSIPFFAVPTTAGTGSEATRFAVIYYQGKKQSVTSESCIPDAVLLDPNCLFTLPLYQRKATMMDAFCHALESFWSVHSTEKSREYSCNALIDILENVDGYLSNTEEGNRNMLLAAHMAGKAINVAQTTAGHAMCYQITSLFGCAHGHAAALCDRVLFPWMIENTEKCTDFRGKAYLAKTLDEIGQALGCQDASAGAEKFAALFQSLNLEVPKAAPEQYTVLRASVNPVRLKNHPIALDEEVIDELYHKILR